MVTSIDAHRSTLYAEAATIDLQRYSHKLIQPVITYFHPSFLALYDYVTSKAVARLPLFATQKVRHISSAANVLV
jgi:hypothetical protein